MEERSVKAVAKYIRSSAQKVRIPADIVRGMMAVEAVEVLKYMPKAAADDVKKVINSAIANARNNNGMDESTLYIHEIKVDEGPAYRRYKEGSKGSYNPFVKRTCHVSVELRDLSTIVQTEGSKTIVKKAESKKEVSKKSAENDTKKKPVKRAAAKIKAKSTKKRTESKNVNNKIKKTPSAKSKEAKAKK